MKHLTILAVLSLATVACKSSGVDQAASASTSMKEMHSTLAQAPAKIEAVTASLAALSAQGADMTAAYATFSENVDALLAHREQVRNASADAQAHKAAFTAAWDERLKTIQDAGLRQKAEERRDSVKDEFAAVRAAADQTKADFEPWIQKVVDVRTYLESDLNPTGVASVSDEVEDLAEDGAGIAKEIEQLIAELDRVAQAIAAAKPPAE